MTTGLLFVVSGPSGAGKSTLCQALLKKWANLRYSISCTTRPPRSVEVDGKDYIFLSESEFQKKLRAGGFLEWARVHDHYYGTLKAPLMKNLRRGLDMILDVDPQGALSIKKAFGDCICIFICPPNWEALENRLRARAQDDDKTIRKRLTNARKEMTYASQYDYMVVNEEFEEAAGDLSAVIRAEHRRVLRLAHELARFGIREGDKK